MKRTLVAALVLALAAAGLSCAGKAPSAPVVDPLVLPPSAGQAGDLYVLGADGQVKVVVWDGEKPVKTVSVFAGGEVVEQELVEDALPPAVPRLTAVAYQGRDLTYVPLRGRSPLAYDTDYVIGPEDELDVQVWKNEELSKQVQVRPDGKVTLPLVQDVVAAGLTRTQFQQKLVDMLKEFIADPEVTVTIVQANSYQVFVQGRVQNPGKYPIKGTTTLVQAIAMAGGFTEWADTGNILVVRRTQGGESRLAVNYKRIVRENEPAPDFVLQPGDTIVVP